jgi:ATP-dependent Clp protease ATP-binding subunit ClpA
MMFERFTEGARAVVIGAREHSQRLGHHWIGSEHLLLAIATADTPEGEVLRDNGITRERIDTILGGPSAQGGVFGTLDRDALATVGIDVDAVRDAVEQSFGAGALDSEPPRGRRKDRRAGHQPFTPEAKKCLENSLRLAEAEHSGHIDGSHVAQAVLGTRHDTVKRILAAGGVSPAQLRTAISDRYRQAG